VTCCGTAFLDQAKRTGHFAARRTVHPSARVGSDSQRVFCRWRCAMPTTRRDLFKSAAPTLAAWALGFPAVAAAEGRANPLPSSHSTVAANGYLSSLLPVADRVALRRTNAELTRLGIQQCAGAGGVANQIVFDTLICEALAQFLAHDVSADRLLALSRDFDV